MSATQEATAENIKTLRIKTGAGVMDCKKALVESKGDIEEAVAILRKKGLADIAKRAGRLTNEGVVVVKVSADGKTAVMAELNCETDFVAKTDDFKKLASDIAEHLLKNTAEPCENNPAVKKMIETISPKFGENTTLKGAVRYTAAGEDALAYYIHGDNKKGALVEISLGGALAGNKAAAERLGREAALQAVAMTPRWVKREEVPAEAIEKEKEIYREQAKNSGKPQAAIEKMLEGKIKKFFEDACINEQASIRDSKMSFGDYLSAEAKKENGTAAVIRFERYG